MDGHYVPSLLVVPLELDSDLLEKYFVITRQGRS